MVVIIGGSSTVVSSQFSGGGIVSVNFGFQPQVQRLFQLGSFSPYDTTVQKTRTLSVVVYGSRPGGGGGSTPLSVPASTSCTNDSISITVNPGSCSATVSPFVDNYFVNSYSYSKDNLGYGQETWGFTTKPVIPGFTGDIFMLRGIPEGTITVGAGVVSPGEMGVSVDESSSNDSLGSQILGESGSVSAGSPGIGNFDTTRYVVVTSIGGSVGKNTSVDGKTGQANISIPITTVYA